MNLKHPLSNPEQYGFCPICGAPGIWRDRNPEGNDRCINLHVYPSKDALNAPPALLNAIDELDGWRIRCNWKETHVELDEWLKQVIEGARTAAALAIKPKQEPRYLIWSNEHNAWWGPKSMGYVLKIKNAGVYTEAEALEICRGANLNLTEIETPSEIMVREDHARPQLNNPTTK